MKFDLFFDSTTTSLMKVADNKRKRRKGSYARLMNFSHTKLIVKIMSVDHVNDKNTKQLHLTCRRKRMKDLRC